GSRTVTGARPRRAGARAPRVLARTLRRPDRCALSRGARTPLAVAVETTVDRRRGEQSEHEVPRHPVARRAGEEHRRERLVDEEDERKGEQAPRHDRKAEEAQNEQRDRVRRLGPRANALVATSFGPALGLDRAGVPEHPRRLLHEPQLLDRVLPPEPPRRTL